jgi:hypothetical protein
VTRKWVITLRFRAPLHRTRGRRGQAIVQDSGKSQIEEAIMLVTDDQDNQELTSNNKPFHIIALVRLRDASSTGMAFGVQGLVMGWRPAEHLCTLSRMQADSQEPEQQKVTPGGTFISSGVSLALKMAAMTIVTENTKELRV